MPLRSVADTVTTTVPLTLAPFAGPLVISPRSVLAVEVISGASVGQAFAGVLWCDGRRRVDLPPGARSGLRDALDTLEGLPGIGVVRFDRRDVAVSRSYAGQIHIAPVAVTPARAP